MSASYEVAKVHIDEDDPTPPQSGVTIIILVEYITIDFVIIPPEEVNHQSLEEEFFARTGYENS